MTRFKPWADEPRALDCAAAIFRKLRQPPRITKAHSPDILSHAVRVSDLQTAKPLQSRRRTCRYEGFHDPHYISLSKLRKKYSPFRLLNCTDSASTDDKKS
jgi:hypothetical protein